MNVADKREPTVGELLGSLATTTASLVKQEVRLASAEMAHKTTTAAGAVASAAMGALILQLGLMLLSAAVVIGLAAVMPMWLTATMLGALVTIVGGALLSKGIATLKHINPVPTETLKTLKDDAVWAKEQVR